LIKEGAKLVEQAEDIVSEIQELKNLGKRKKKEIKKTALSREENLIWDILSEDPLHIDQIATKTETSTSEALALLLSLEMKDYVRQLSGMCFIRR
jgi:DNA processing protein